MFISFFIYVFGDVYFNYAFIKFVINNVLNLASRILIYSNYIMYLKIIYMVMYISMINFYGSLKHPPYVLAWTLDL